MAVIPLDDAPITSTEPTTSAPAAGRVIPLEGMSTPSTSEPEQSMYEKIKSSIPTIDRDRIYANARAAYAGALRFGSTLTKVAEKLDTGMRKTTEKLTGLKPPENGPFSLKGLGAEGQKAFEEAQSKYEINKEKYPETRVSNFLGELASEGPLVSGKAITAGVNLGEKLAGKTGGLLGAIGSGGATGAAVGGLSNEVGQSPDKAWDPNGAMVGGTLGGMFGPVGGLLVPRWAGTTTAYQEGKDALRSAGYEGQVLARDFSPEGIARDTKNRLLDNIPMVGTAATRGQQLEGISSAVKKLVGSIGANTTHESEAQIGAIINKTRDTMAKHGDEMWKDVFSTAKTTGLNKVPLDENVKTAVQDLSTKYANDISKSDMKKFIDPLVKYRDVSPDYLHQLKRDLWPMYTKAAKKDTTIQENLANDLKDLYFKVDDNIGKSFKGVPGLEEKYLAAKEYTKNMLNVFDPKKDRPLAMAIKEVNDKSENLRGFVNSIMTPKSAKTADYYNKVFGEEYQGATENLALQKAFKKGLDYTTGDLNLGSFFKDATTAAGNRLIKNKTWNALQGLEKYTQTVTQAKQVAEHSAARSLQTALPVTAAFSVAGALTGGSTGALSGGAAAGATASAAALGWLSKHSPVKNSLIALSNVWDKNPEITKSLLTKLGRALPAIGVTMIPEGDGDARVIRIDKEKK